MNIKVTVYESVGNREVLNVVFKRLDEAKEFIRKILNLWVNDVYKPMSDNEVKDLTDLKRSNVEYYAIGILTCLKDTECDKKHILDNVYGLYTHKGDLGKYYICMNSTDDKPNNVTEDIIRKHIIR